MPHVVNVLGHKFPDPERISFWTEANRTSSLHLTLTSSETFKVQVGTLATENPSENVQPMIPPGEH